MSLLLEEVARLKRAATEVRSPNELVLWENGVVQLSRRLGDAGYWESALELLDSSTFRSGHSTIQIERCLVAAECEISLERFEGALRELRALETMLANEESPRADVLNRIRLLKAVSLVGLSDLAAGERLLRSTYQILLNEPDSALLGWCACNLGNIEWSRGALHAAKNRYLEACVSAERSGERRLKATALRNLGLILRQQCWWKHAEENLSQSSEIWKQIDNSLQHAHVCRSIAVLYWKHGKLDAAFKQADHSLEIAERSGMEKAAETARLVLGCLALHAGEFGEATKSFGSAFSSIHSRQALLSAEFLGDVHLEQGQAAEALKYYDEVWPKAMALVPKGDIVAELRRRRAECYLLLGRKDEAYAAAKEGLDHCRELGDRYEEAATYRVLALSAAALGKHDEARQHFTQGFAYYDDIETPYEWGKLWMAYGDWLLGSNPGRDADRSAAREAYLAARDYFSNMGARAKLREAETRLRTLDAQVAQPRVVVEESTPASSILRRPQRRPTSQTVLERRAEGVWQDWYIVTRHEPLLNILDRAAKLALSDVPILVTGETGTGKELVAAGIHRASKLAGNYVPLNCAAVPKEMIESELFGHVRGAFSGAIAERQGLVEMAAKGTLFLDEVGEMAEAMQAKLLRFLESGEYRRVGESAHRIAKTRLVAATNVSRDRLEKGEGFRNDLYWRLAQGVLEVPALRHRPGDVPVLVEHFLRIEARKMDKRSLIISEAAQAELSAYAWPGNVRELVGVIRRAVALAEHTIEPEHLDLTSAREVAVTLTEEMAATERVKLARAMKEHGDSPTAAARALGIPRTTLLMKLKRYGMR